MAITYSLDLIRGLGSDLQTVADVMDGRNAAAQFDEPEVGSEVASALEHFSNNWNDKRELLTQGMRNVGNMAQSTADSFEDFDQQMADQVVAMLEPQP